MTETISISQLKATRTEDIVKRKCVAVESDGEFVGFLIIRPEMGMKDQVNGIATIIEAGRERESWNQS